VDMTQLHSYLTNVTFLVFASVMATITVTWLAIFLMVDLECLNRLRPHPTSIFTTLGCALSAACCGTLTQIFLKVLSLVVREALQYHQFNPNEELAPAIICGVLLLCTALTQIYLINATMSSGKVIIAVPSYSSLTIVLTICGAAIFYGDFDTLSRSDIINFAIGVCIVAVGIVLLSVLQWCRQQRKGKPVRMSKSGSKAHESDSLVASTNTKGKPITKPLSEAAYSLDSSSEKSGAVPSGAASNSGESAYTSVTGLSKPESGYGGMSYYDGATSYGGSEAGTIRPTTRRK